MAEYKTEQKQQLLEYLRRNRESAFTVEELADGICAENHNHAPGKSTLYRQINKMVEEGKVKRIVKGNSRHFVYQITEEEGCHAHLHMKCVECGKLLHLDDDLSRELMDRVRRSSSFSVDGESTVLFGECALCSRERGKA
jgi:Fur family ferric uptake transcriptional regulator